MICLNNTDTLEGGASVTGVVDYLISGLVGTTFTNIAQGQLSDTNPSVLYTAAAAISIVSVIFVNTHSAAVTVDLYLDPANAGTPRRMIPKALSLGIGYSMVWDGARFGVYDANGVMVSGTNVSDTAYAASWDNVTTIAPSKNAVYDKIQTLASGGANSDITSMTALTQITRATGGAFDIAIGSAPGDDFTVDTDKLVVEGDTGNVGIGTTTPLSKLAVSGGMTIGANYNVAGPANGLAIEGNVGIGTTGPQAPLNTYATPTSGFVPQIIVGGTGNYRSLDLGTYGAYDGYISTYGNDLRILAGRGVGSENHNIHFYTGFNGSGGAAESNERMTIQYNGNVGIGTTSPNYQLELSTDSAGKPGAGGLWTIVSDERIKENIKLADLERCYEIIKSIPLKRFTWRDESYSKEQIKDRSSLGWLAQDVQPIFPKAVNVTPFTKAEKIPDGDEEYEEQDFVIEIVDQQQVEMIDGKAVLITKQIEQKNMLFDELSVQDETGNLIIDKNGKPLIHKIPRMVKKTRPKFRQEVIEDCLDLNSGQIIAAMYGALQKAMMKIKALEVQIAVVVEK